MESARDRKSEECRVVVGPEEAAAARAAWPDIPIVALVEASEPDQAVYARSAGADVVLPAIDLASGWRRDTPGLAVAVSAATSLAQRRAGAGKSSRRAAHDIGQALSAINLAAELAIRDGKKNDRLLRQIMELAHDAGAHAWSAGRAGRSTGLALRPVDLSALLHRMATAEPDVVVYNSSQAAWVLGDTSRIEHLLEELVDHVRRSSTGARIVITVAEGNSIEMVIRGSGVARSAVPAADGELRWAMLSEMVNDLGGQVQLRPDSDTLLSSESVRLSLPLLPHLGNRAGLVTVPPDRMAIQTNILEGVLRHAPLPESLEAIVAAIERQLPGTKCSVLLSGGGCLHHGAGASLPEAYREEIDGVSIGYGQGSCGTSAYLGRPVIASDVATNPHWVNFKDLALLHNLRSCWSTPILADGGDVLGTFAVYREEVWEPDDAATRLISRFTYLAAVAIGHHRLFNAVAESESRFRSAFEGATTGMALVSQDGGFLKVNPALCAMLQATSTELCQSNLLDCVETNYRDRVLNSWRDLLAANPIAVGHGDGIEVLLKGPDWPEPLWASLGTSLVKAENDQQHFYVEIRDISARRRHASEQRARQAAEAASQAKSDFLALVSHELRTPLNAILGFAQLMKLVQLDPQAQSDSLDNILKGGQHLLDLINELLDLSRVEAGKFNTIIEDVDASDAINEALEILGPLADSHQIAVHTSSQTEMEIPAIRADRQGLRQVLINLLGNAVKFTPVGGEVNVLLSQTQAGSIRISVRDSGPGVPPDSHERLFEPFHRIPSTPHPETEGTGLGLAVAARLMKEMHGTIGIDSEVGFGSCFWVELPAGAAAPHGAVPDPDDSRPIAQAQPLTAGRVLYIEDDPASVQVIAATLALRPSIDLTTASTAAEGTAALRDHDFDVILLDIGLPDGCGWDLLATLREEPCTASIPVVVLTAGSCTAPRGKPDPDVVLAKPLDISVCLEKIDALLASAC